MQSCLFISVTHPSIHLRASCKDVADLHQEDYVQQIKKKKFLVLINLGNFLLSLIGNHCTTLMLETGGLKYSKVKVLYVG